MLFFSWSGSHGDDGPPEGQHGDADFRGESHFAGAPRADRRARAAGEAYPTVWLLTGSSLASDQ